MWGELLKSVLSIFDKLLGLRVARTQDPDVRAAAKAEVDVKNQDAHEKTVHDAVQTGDLDELRKQAGE